MGCFSQSRRLLENCYSICYNKLSTLNTEYKQKEAVLMFAMNSEKSVLNCLVTLKLSVLFVI